MYERGAKEVIIFYRSGKQNTKADALSRCSHLPVPVEGIAESEVQVETTSSQTDTSPSTDVNLDFSQTDISRLLRTKVTRPRSTGSHFGVEQCRDPDLSEIIAFLEHQQLPEEERRARKVAAQAPQFTLLDGILFYVNPKDNTKRAAVPDHLRDGENHGGPLAGHFTGIWLYSTLFRHWWWDGMYSDVYRYCQYKTTYSVPPSQGQAGHKTSTPAHPGPTSVPGSHHGIPNNRAWQPVCNSLSI